MANPINSPTVIGGIAVLVVVTAVILGLTGFKLKPAASNGNQNANTNSSTQSATAVPTYSFPGRLPDDRILNKQARIVTNKGTIVFTLDVKQSPLAVSNLVYLAEQKYYDQIRWHRVEDWVVQMGDPQTKDASVNQQLWGTGGPGYTIPDEPVSGDYAPGVVAMAKTAAPNSAGSQIFIIKTLTGLDKKYQIIGRVAAGMDVVNALTVGDVAQSVTIEPAD